MHSANLSRTPVQLGLLHLSVPMESIFCKQFSEKPTNFFPDQDGNISTVERKSFPYSMLMDFGASLQIDDSIDQADRIPHDTSLEANQSQQRNRLQKTTEQIKAVATCQEFVNPTSGQPQHQATTTSLTPPVQSIPNVAQPASSATNVSTSSSVRSSSSQPPDSSRPAIGQLCTRMILSQTLHQLVSLLACKQQP